MSADGMEFRSFWRSGIGNRPRAGAALRLPTHIFNEARGRPSDFEVVDFGPFSSKVRSFELETRDRQSFSWAKKKNVAFEFALASWRGALLNCLGLHTSAPERPCVEPREDGRPGH
jgi:hypothetical protein